MKILLVAKNLSTGTSRYTTQFLEHAGSDQNAIFLSLLGGDPPKQPTSEHPYRIFLQQGPLWLAGHLFVWFLRVIGLRLIIIKHRIDVVLAQNLDESALIASTAAFGLRPVVSFVHDLTDKELMFYRATWTPWRISFLRGLIGIRQSLVMRLCSRLIVASNFMKDSLEKRGAQKVELIPLGVDHTNFTKNHKKSGDDLSIIAVGILTMKKRFDTLIRAMSLLKNLDVKLTLVGSGPLKDDLESLATNLGVNSKVSFEGFLDDDALRKKIIAADLAVVPSQWEGFGLFALEAMSAGLPVVASNGGALPELVKDGINGAIFEVGNYSELAAIIKRLYEDRSELRRLATGAYDSANQYSWDKTFVLTNSCLVSVTQRFSKH